MKIRIIFRIFLLLILMTSCDYGKDISDLQDRVDNLENSFAQLKNAWEAGKVIVKVEASNANGYEIHFSDGTRITLSHGQNGSDGTDGTNGINGITPIVKIDSSGYWVISYDNESSFSRLTDSDGNYVIAIGKNGEDGKCVRIKVDSKGYYIFEIYDPAKPDIVIRTIATPYSSNPSSVLRSIVKDENNGVITLTLGDGKEFKFNLDVSYPASIIVLEDIINLSAVKDRCITFRLNPSDAFINFVPDGENTNIELDIVTASRANDLNSYSTKPTGFVIKSVALDKTEDGKIKKGQYKAEISSLNNGQNIAERVCLVITTKNSKGETIQISSNPFSIANGQGTEIISVTINGVNGVKTGNIFQVKLPPTTDRSSLKPEFTGNCTAISAKSSKETRSYSENIDFTNPVTFIATGPDGKTEEYTVAITFSSLPTVYINTTAPILGKKEWVKNNSICIFNASERNNNYKASIKGRGNSTWGYPKKPYAIKLDKKEEVLGMPKHKRWCLLANWMDRTNIRNDVAFEIGRRMSGLDWTPRGQFVDVVFNGQYVGNYYLCEQIKIDKNRVNIDEMSTSDISNQNITGGYLLEFDTNYDEVNKFKTQILKLPVNFKDPDEEILQPSQYEYLRNYINTVESKLVSLAPFSEIDQLLDIDSYIDWWLLHELVLNFEPIHPKSSYMYKDRNGKLYAGPIWDFDYCTFSEYSKLEYWVDIKAMWYPYLFKYPEFVAEVKNRWSIHKNILISIPDYIKEKGNNIMESSLYDCQLWSISTNVNGDETLSYPESLDKMIKMYVHRFNWIDKNISNL